MADARAPGATNAAGTHGPDAACAAGARAPGATNAADARGPDAACAAGARAPGATNAAGVHGPGAACAADARAPGATNAAGAHNGVAWPGRKTLSGCPESREHPHSAQWLPGWPPGHERRRRHVPRALLRQTPGPTYPLAR
ncbi:MAG: hypothetical protein ACRC1I_13355 [Pseudomonas proteolytica]|uniref:hypothetical protein n=1 Tax=Pseudomonas proteolytica TaxID=219574 RepID=UPI003F3BFA9E